MLKLRHKILAATLLFTSPIFTIAQTTPSAAQTTPTAPKTTASAPKTLIDINSTNPEELKTLPGIGDAYAKRIIDGRPYTAKNQLVTRGILPQGVYNKIKDQIIASHPKK